MKHTQEIPTYNFLKGHDFTNNLKRILGCKNLQEVSSMTGVSTSTLSTWNMENRTSYELMIRIHIALHVPIRELALEYPTAKDDDESLKITESYSDSNWASKSPIDIRNNTSFNIKTYQLRDGRLENGHFTLFDAGFLPNINHEHTIAIKEQNKIHIIDTQIQQAVSGIYLVDIDGLLSLNDIQRIPGKKLAITLHHTTLEVNEENITIVGKLLAEITIDKTETC